jgi:hypothetical protein
MSTLSLYEGHLGQPRLPIYNDARRLPFRDWRRVMKKRTTTSSFGTGKRESHDSSAFYSRQLYNAVSAEPMSEAELKKIPVPVAGAWANQVYCASSEKMEAVPDNSVALAFTSPPYNVGKDYDADMTLEGYLELIQNVGREVYRVLRPGGM